MDGREPVKRSKNPRETANPLSALTFFWVFPTFRLGYRRDLEVSDLHEPLKEHTSGIIGEKLSSLWANECRRQSEIDERKGKISGKGGKKEKRKKPSLLKALLKCFGPELMLYGLTLIFVELVSRITQPLLLAGLLRYYNDGAISKGEAYLYAAGVIACSVVYLLFIYPYIMGCMHMGMKVRVACCSMIYRKALRLSKTALGETTVGQAVNLLSNDVNRFDVGILFLHFLWVVPIEVAIITYLMYLEMGYSALIGVAALLVFVPLQAYLSKKASVLRFKTAGRTDERVRLTNEILNGIQAIKMYTWEHPFGELVAKARRKEISVIRSLSYIRGVTLSFLIFTTRLCVFVTIVAYVLFGETLTAEKVFLVTAYYNVLMQAVTICLSHAITQVAEMCVSVRRLENFMLYDEIKPVEGTKSYSNADSKENGKKKSSDAQERIVSRVSIENGSAKWTDTVENDTLKGINLKVDPGELIAIVGQVGAGKSSLLNVILNELPLHTGTVQVNGSIAYASQEPWLFSAPIRQNILFGRQMDSHQYERVVNVCQLKRDFSLFSHGDKTIVGERGISLSGGQRARVNLARAVYADADIYLLDDPLSAVDAHVGRHMFEECIEKYLRGKTRILVTHQLQYLRNVGRIVVLKDGAIQAEGTYEELVRMGVDFGRLLENEVEADENPPTTPTVKTSSRKASLASHNSFTSTKMEEMEDADEEEEMRTSGRVSGAVYNGYFSSGGSWCFVALAFGLCVLAQLGASSCDFFIAQWVNMEQTLVAKVNDTITAVWDGPLTREDFMYIYTALIVFTIIVTFVRSFTFFSMCMRASVRLHDRLFHSISRATMRFFNTNTSGRILNRFSKDIGAVDELLPMALTDAVQIMLAIVGIVVLVAVSNPWLIIPTVVIGIIFYFARVLYLMTSRSVKRLEGITRSPVFAHMTATMQGLPTIRAFKSEGILVKEFDHHQDLHSSAWYTFIGTAEAFGFWLDMFCVVYILLVTLSFLVLFDNTDEVQGGSVGLAITQSIGLTGMFQWGMRQSAEQENQMTSVERIIEYSKLEKEPPLESEPGKKPKEQWPEEGGVAFKDVSLRYGPTSPTVLKNLRFTVLPREKIGIVGRTGAGKSSLIQALFRLADLEGTIEIDGIDSTQIGLHDLRSKISIIPQEPFLFSGTLRRNLDPFDTYSDHLLWEALAEVELKEMGLDAHITDGGSNLSVGQKQLVCLARAIVRNNRVLVLDEATANVDPRTDELIQMTIRRKFADSTVFTIAHRLNTVMDSDRILVMDAGNAVEFDYPHVLLQKESGYLRNMVQETGKAMAEALAAVAEESYRHRRSTSL